jgi:hypothetical protein
MTDFEQYKGFINPDYRYNAAVSGYGFAVRFEVFHRSNLRTLEHLKESGKLSAPINPFLFNTHMEAYVRALDEAKDHFLKACLAYSSERDESLDEGRPGSPLDGTPPPDSGARPVASYADVVKRVDKQ